MMQAWSDHAEEQRRKENEESMKAAEAFATAASTKMLEQMQAMMTMSNQFQQMQAQALNGDLSMALLGAKRKYPTDIAPPPDLHAIAAMQVPPPTTCLMSPVQQHEEKCANDPIKMCNAQHELNECDATRGKINVTVLIVNRQHWLTQCMPHHSQLPWWSMGAVKAILQRRLMASIRRRGGRRGSLGRQYA